MFGKKDADRNLIEVPMVVGVTYPNGKFISSMFLYTTKEENDAGLIPAGSLFSVNVAGNENGTKWDDCINGTNQMPLDAFMTNTYCKIGKTIFPNGKLLESIQAGKALPEDAFLMGAFLNPIETLNRTTMVVTTLTFDVPVLPVCKQ